ncbi:MAG: ABC transporter substrate-binding protein, partial [Gemmatimonadales bacterium]
MGEPASIFPPLVMETVGRDISDQVFERLADLQTGQPTVDESAYAPRLARSWERVDSLTLRFNLREGAEWHDGTPVTAEDVVYSFQVFRSPEVDALARSQLENRVASVTAEDSNTVLVKFTRAYPEQMYDATYHVRIIPAHIWRDIPVADWPGDTSLAHLVGTGPYRVSRWQRGQSLELVEVERDGGGVTTEIPRVIWRFANDPQAAFNLIASHEADMFESLTMDMVERLASDTTYRLLPYPSAVYGFLGFRVSDDRGRPTPVLGDRGVRRALAAAIDRRSLARAVYGPETRVPAGPYSQLLWVGAGEVVQPQWDSTAADAMLDRQGWRPGADSVRRKNGERLEVAIMVPSTSGGRMRMAEIIQEQWRQIGVSASITAVDFPVFQSRLAQGNFDSYIGAWLDEPSPRGLGDQWTREAWDALNYGHYDNPAFDSLFRAALAIKD